MKALSNGCACLALMSVAVLLVSAGASHAGGISDYEYIMKTEYSSHQGVISSISRDGSSLLVSGRKIWLVDVRYQGSTFATVVHEESGRVIDAGRLQAGDRVYVFGGGRRDDEIAAKDIFLLERKLSEKEFRDFPRDRALRTWKSEVRAGRE